MFFQNLVQMGGFELNHHWHGINVLSILECALLAACLCTGLALFFRFVRKSKRLTALSLVGALSFATAAYAANTALSGLSASGALAGANLIYVVQTVGVGGVKATMTQVATFINSLFSGDFTCTSGGVCTVTKINGVTPPSPIGTVTSLTGACGVTASPSTITTTGSFSANVTATTNSGTTDTITNALCGQVREQSNAASGAISITTAGFVSGNYFTVKNVNAGVATYTPTSGTIGGAATLVCQNGQSSDVFFDGTNFITLGNTCGLGTASTANTGTSGGTLPFLNGTNTFSGTQTFGSVFGTVTTQSGTTYTLASTDCGTQVAFTNAAAVTVTIPAALTTGCNIALLQTTAAGQVTVTGTAVSAATLHSGHSYTKTFGQWAIIGINIYTTGVAILTGDGA